MAGGEAAGSNEVLTLKISFQELEDTAFLLGKLKDKPLEYSEVKNSRGEFQVPQGAEDSCLEGRKGVFYIKPTNSSTSDYKARIVAVNDKTHCSRSSEKAPQVEVQGAGRVPERTRSKTRDLVTEHRSQSTGSRQPKSRSGDKDDKKMIIPAQMRSKSTGDQPRRSLKVELRHLLTEWDRLDCKKVERNLSRWRGDVADLGSTLKLSQRMCECVEKILSKDLELYSRQNLCAKLWKGAIYPIIEKLRTQRSGEVQQVLAVFLESNVNYYMRCVQLVQNNLNFRLSTLTSGLMQFSSKTRHREVMLGVVMCHHWYIYLGDLSRYQQQLFTLLGSEVNWAKPRQFYSRAQQLVPKDGKPYNQLAVVALNTHRRLDAVYYYMRSLATVPSFQSAYDSLVAIFAETGKKAQRKEEDERMSREREALMATRKRRKEEKLARKKEKQQQRKLRAGERGGNNEGGSDSHFSGKKEVWIMPGTAASQEGVASPIATSDEVDQTKDTTEHEEKESESLSQVAKRMTSLFLIIHGKLFSKTGSDSLSLAETKLQQLLAELLSKTLRHEYALLLFKMAVINIYSIHHHTPDESSLASPGAFFHCGRVLRLTLVMTQVLILSCSLKLDQLNNEFKKAHGIKEVSSNGNLEGMCLSPQESSGACLIPESVLEMLCVPLPAARLLLDWLLAQEELALKCIPVVDLVLWTNLWNGIAEFLNQASDLGVREDRLSHNGDRAREKEVAEREEEKEEVGMAVGGLWEDRSLAGFMPLKPSLGTMETFSLPQMKKLTNQQHREQVVHRILLLRQMWRKLCFRPHLTGVELGHDPTTSRVFVGTRQTTPASDEQRECQDAKGGVSLEEEEEEEVEVDLDSSLSLEFSDEDIEYLSDDYSGREDKEGGGSELDMEDEGGSAVASEIQLLKARRDDLARQLEERELAEAMAQTVLAKAASKSVAEVHITPHYLVPDTNCFVDRLKELQELVLSQHFILAVPLVVVAELEGLSKGDSPPDRTKVSIDAKKSLDYIIQSFQMASPHLKALTTQGNLLPSLSFRAEVTEKVSNDDLILKSCLQLHLKTKSNKPGEAAVYKVVLLTDDRNLRVKAHAAEQPVRDIPSFMAILNK